MRPEKVHIVADIQTKLKNSPFLLIADYSGMQVKHFEELRLRLARVDAEIHVIRNTFIKRAIKGLGLPELNGALTGQTAMVTGESDICAAAKVLKTFVTEFERPPVKGGILDDEILNADQIKALAELRRMSCKRSCSVCCSRRPPSLFGSSTSRPPASPAFSKPKLRPPASTTAVANHRDFPWRLKPRCGHEK